MASFLNHLYIFDNKFHSKIFIVKDIMNYQRIYNQICQRAKTELEERKTNNQYYEGHHIIPQVLGGEGKSRDWNHENITPLSPREHFLCHWLLHEIYPDNNKLFYAFRMMCKVDPSKHKNRFIPSLRVLERLKLESIKRQKGKPISEETRLKISNSKKGKPISEETRLKISNSTKGKKLSNSHKENIKKSSIGRKCPHNIITNKNKIGFKHSPESIEKIKNSSSLKKSICQFDLHNNLINIWSSMNDASRSTAIPACNISTCCNNKRKTAGGFIWTMYNQI